MVLPLATPPSLSPIDPLMPLIAALPWMLLMTRVPARVVDDVHTKANVRETMISPVDTILAYLPLSERRLTAGKGGEGERDALLVC